MAEKLAPEKRHAFVHNGEPPPLLLRTPPWLGDLFQARLQLFDLGFDPPSHPATPAMSRAEGV